MQKRLIALYDKYYSPLNTIVAVVVMLLVVAGIARGCTPTPPAPAAQTALQQTPEQIAADAAKATAAAKQQADDAALANTAAEAKRVADAKAAEEAKVKAAKAARDANIALDGDIAVAKANANFNASAFVQSRPDLEGYVVIMNGDSTQDITCPQGDKWASGFVSKTVDGKTTTLPIKCSTYSASQGCWLESEFKTKPFAKQEKVCANTATMIYPFQKLQ